MTNALTTVSSNVPAYPAGGNPFLDAAEDMGASSGAMVLRFDGNTGQFSFGKDREELEHGTRLAVNPSEFRLGWICWNDGEVLDQRMTRIVDGRPPAKGDLPDHGPYADQTKDGWREQASAMFRDIETGDEFKFDTSSKGGRIALGNLVRDYGKAFQQHPGELAIVELGNVAFDAKDEKGRRLGRKYAPQFKIVTWILEAELIAKFEAASDSSGEAEQEDDVPVNTGGGRRNRNF